MTVLVAESGKSPAQERRTFESRLEEHRGIIFKVANTYCRSVEERDDLVQDICLQLWRAYPSYDPQRRFSTWMYRVALNTAISSARAARRREWHTVSLDESAAPEAVALDPRERDADVARLYRMLHGLGELDRALVLLYFEERSYREIAEVLGISETNVGTRLARVRQKLRRDLQRAEGDEHGAR